MARTGRELADAQWERLAPLLPHSGPRWAAHPTTTAHVRNDSVAGPHRRPVARPPGSVRQVAERGQPVRPLAACGRGQPGPGRLARPRRCRWRVGLAAALRGRLGGARPPARRWRASAAQQGRQKGSSIHQTKPSDVAAAGCPPSCTCAPRGTASRWSCWSPPGRPTKRRCCARSWRPVRSSGRVVMAGGPWPAAAAPGQGRGRQGLQLPVDPPLPAPALPGRSPRRAVVPHALLDDCPTNQTQASKGLTRAGDA
jgi:hypothetical protein